MNEKRFQEMKKLHSSYFPYYEKHILDQLKTIPEEGIKNMLKNFVIERIGKRPGIRAYIFKKIWDLLGLKENEQLHKLCAAIEMQLGQTYSFNVGADNKSEFGMNKKVCFDTAKRMLEIHKNYVTKNFGENVWNIFKEIYDIFYNAQVIDTLINLYPNLNKSIGRILDEILKMNEKDVFYKTGIEKRHIEKIYEKFGIFKLSKENLYDFVKLRTYGINAHMIEQYPRIIEIILKSSDKMTKNKISSLKKYCKYYGMAMMIINDVQDFALDLEKKFEATREKNITDVFNDIINKKITYPIMFALTNKDKEIEYTIDKAYNNPTLQNLEKLRGELIEKGYIRRSILEAVAYAHLGIEKIREISMNKIEMLEDIIISISLFSKYIKYLRKKYNVKLRPSKSEIKKRKEELKRELTKENLEILLK